MRWPGWGCRPFCSPARAVMPSVSSADMCIILLAHKAHPGYPLVVAANRDEAYARPAAPAAFWEDHPRVYGGRDLEKGGSWLGLTRSGRIAAVTNFRNGRPGAPAPRSRGELVSGFLTGGEDAE